MIITPRVVIGHCASQGHMQMTACGSQRIGCRCQSHRRCRMHEYDCAKCGGHFASDWSDDEAWAEARALWRKEDLKSYAVVCESCFKDMTATKPPAEFNAEQDIA